MKPTRRILTVLLTGLTVLSLGPPSQAAEASVSPPGHHGGAKDNPQVAYDWQRTAIRTIYTDAALPIPAGSLYLGFTSLAVRDAYRAAAPWRGASAPAAVAAAAHGVLVAYFPAFKTQLDADLATSLATVPDGRAEARGIRIGERAAAAMVADRVDDGRNAPITYSRPPAPGVWQPPATGMAVAWLGFVDPLVLRRPIAVDGPDALTSAAYAADYAEVKRMGSATAPLSDRSAQQTETARFFNDSSIKQMHAGLLGYLGARNVSLDRVTRIFARVDAAVADSLIQGWRLKYEVGFWRPFQAIPGAGSDGNDATTPDAGWAPLVPTPPYADYVSGHSLIVAPTVQVLRSEFGDGVSLTFSSAITGTQRTYPNLTQLEYDALNARIWLGIHFRDAMEDGYRLGHETARQVINRVR